MHSFPGFSRLRMHTKGGSPVAFVEYQDVRYAAQAMATLQGSFLLSSDRGAIRIEYAKSKMAEVGFTNLWIEVGFILCYASRIQDTVSTKRNPDENAASLCDTFTPDICIYIYNLVSILISRLVSSSTIVPSRDHDTYPHLFLSSPFPLSVLSRSRKALRDRHRCPLGLDHRSIISHPFVFLFFSFIPLISRSTNFSFLFFFFSPFHRKKKKRKTLQRDSHRSAFSSLNIYIPWGVGWYASGRKRGFFYVFATFARPLLLRMSHWDTGFFSFFPPFSSPVIGILGGPDDHAANWRGNDDFFALLREERERERDKWILTEILIYLLRLIGIVSSDYSISWYNIFFSPYIVPLILSFLFYIYSPFLKF